MTKKRFIYIDTLMFVEKRRKAIFEKGGDRLFDEEVVSMFNKLLKENDQLKEELADINELNKIYVDFLVDKGFELFDVVEWSKKELKK